MLLQALSDTTVVRASVFLLGRGVLLSLADIPPGGATVSLLGRQHGKAVYRLSIHTRSREIFDMAINVAEELSFAQLRDEVNWLLAAGAPPPLVEQFAGYFGEWGIFTEEFIPGNDVERQVARLLRQGGGQAARAALALRGLAPRWSCTSASGTGPAAGWRCASPPRPPSSSRRTTTRPARGWSPSPTARPAPRSTTCSIASRPASSTGWRDRSPSCAARPPSRCCWPRWWRRWARSAPSRSWRRPPAASGPSPSPPSSTGCGPRGPRPMRLFFAVRRFKRWLEVNPQATPEAQSKHLGEQWGTYRLGELEAQWPDTRIRFFRQTVFADARPELGAALDRLMHRARAMPAGALDLAEQVAALRAAGQADRGRGPRPGPHDLPLPRPRRAGGPHLHAARRPLHRRGGGGPGRQRRQPLHAARPGLAARGGPAAPPLPRVQPAGGLLHRARVPAGPRRQGHGHRRHLLPAGGGRARPHGEAGGGRASTAARGSPTA